MRLLDENDMKISSKLQFMLAGQMAGLTISCCMALWQSSAAQSDNDNAYKVVTSANVELVLAGHSLSAMRWRAVQYQASAPDLALREQLMASDRQSDADFKLHMQTLSTLPVSKAIRVTLRAANDRYQNYDHARSQWLGLVNEGDVAEADAFRSRVLLPSEGRAVKALDALAGHLRTEAFDCDQQRDAVFTMSAVWLVFVTVALLMVAFGVVVLLAQRFVQPRWRRSVSMSISSTLAPPFW